MASGNTHDRIGAISTGILGAIAISQGIPLSLPLGSFVGYYWLSPDVDTRSNPVRRWGPLRGIWAPLQAHTKHRGITHNPVLGAPVVLAYLVCGIVLGINLTKWAIAFLLGQPFVLWLPSLSWIWNNTAWWFVMGVAYQFLCHLIADWVSSAINRQNRRRRKRNR